MGQIIVIAIYKSSKDHPLHFRLTPYVCQCDIYRRTQHNHLESLMPCCPKVKYKSTIPCKKFHSWAAPTTSNELRIFVPGRKQMQRFFGWRKKVFFRPSVSHSVRCRRRRFQTESLGKKERRAPLFFRRQFRATCVVRDDKEGNNKLVRIDFRDKWSLQAASCNNRRSLSLGFT